MNKKIILTDKAPQPIGPYSQAVQFGNLLFCSGQISLDPKSGAVLHEGDVEGQTRQVMENIKGVLSTAGCDFSSIIKTTIFLKTMDDFPKVNAIYGQSFKSDPPARSTVAVAGLPKNVLVEIEVIAGL